MTFFLAPSRENKNVTTSFDYKANRFSREKRLKMNLHDTGLETIEVCSADTIPSIRDWFLRSEKNFPEFSSAAKVYVLGGFAAYGNPSSFHNDLAKHLRAKALSTVAENGVFRRFLEARGEDPTEYGVELLFDRMLHRHANQTPAAESAHRDVTPANYLQKGDVVFGGWINLSERPQYFTCKTGSHVAEDPRSGSKDGFATLTKEEAALEYEPYKSVHEVSPGRMLIFCQTLLHEVSKTKEAKQMRLFVGWRLTKSGKLLFGEEKARVVRDLDVPMLPSGQMPPMYSKNHASAFKNRPFSPRGLNNESTTLMEWIKNSFRDSVLNELGEKGLFSGRIMGSLASYGLKEGYEYESGDARVVLDIHPVG